MERLTIGEFARLSRLSPKALRLYDGLGLVVPADVDPFTGYRRYDRSQVERARLVAQLRQLDMPLAHIRELVDLSPAEAGAALAAWWGQVEAAVDARRQLAGHLVRTFTDGEGGVGTMGLTQEYTVQVREVPERGLLAAQRHCGPAELGAFATELVVRLGGAGLPALPGVEGAPFLVFYGEVSEDSDGPVEFCRPVPAERLEEAAARFPDLESRVERRHREAFVRLTKAQLDATQGLAAYPALERWGAVAGETPSGAPRTVWIADQRTAGPDDPVCDIAFPLRG